ncbi:YheU family protein [Aestuariicella hydrocarbonica]|uniref:YheU family protein n=1 Tax=Pseudomaricurvus hydrocarbonicus TaxID=1470433 RepID=A0A9E5JQT6_9GAMM|nr:YheU family protein [Aestuariicella hydrocarbonica]
MIIPVQQLSADAVQGLIEEFITREGTDYGEMEIALSDKVEQVRAQLASGEVVIVFDTTAESVSLQSRLEADRNERELQQSLNSDSVEAYFNNPKSDQWEADGGQWEYSDGDFNDV